MMITVCVADTHVVVLMFSHSDYCNALGRLPYPLICKLQRVQNCALSLLVHVPPVTSCSKWWFPTKMHASALILPPPLPVCLPYQIMTVFSLDLFTPALTPCCKVHGQR